MTEPKPAVGRIVHFVKEGQCRAAMITEVVEQPSIATGGIVHLTVFEPGWITIRDNVSHVFAGSKMDGTYHWPERV